MPIKSQTFLISLLARLTINRMKVANAHWYVATAASALARQFFHAAELKVLYGLRAPQLTRTFSFGNPL